MVIRQDCSLSVFGLEPISDGQSAIDHRPSTIFPVGQNWAVEPAERCRPLLSATSFNEVSPEVPYVCRRCGGRLSYASVVFTWKWHYELCVCGSAEDGLISRHRRRHRPREISPTVPHSSINIINVLSPTALVLPWLDSLKLGGIFSDLFTHCYSSIRVACTSDTCLNEQLTGIAF